MRLGTVQKQPAERFSYTITYEDALTVGDNIETASAVVDPPGLVIDNVGVYDPRVKLWVSGGANGASYKVTVTCGSAEGRVFQDEIVFKIKEL